MRQEADEPTKEEFLLAILHFGKGVYGKTKLQKLAFLVQREMAGGLFDDTFDFQPYYYGPFAPEIYEVVESLEGEDLISVRERRTEKDGDVVLAHDYELTPEGEEEAAEFLDSLPDDDQAQVRKLVEAHNFRSLAKLLEYTYEEYPEMAERSVWEGV